ncbi:MAG: MMPL family transporter [Desulfobacterales bacterium]|nr:MMPL family transporter [Desulfobacterales bacterium]
MLNFTARKWVYRFIDGVFAHPRRILGLILIMTLFFLYCFFQQTHNNHIRVFFESDDPKFAAYEQFQGIFGSEEFSIVALAHEDLFTNQRLEIIRKLTDALRRVDGVDRVVSLTSVEEFHGTEDTIMLRQVVPDGRLTDSQADRAKARALENRFVNKYLLTPDAQMTAVHVELEGMGEDRKRKTANSVLSVSGRIAGDHFKVYCSGPSFVEVEMNRLSEKDFKTFIPVILVLILILMMLLLRQMSLVLLCEVNLLVILIWGVGFYVFSGESFNIITSTMGAILLAIAVADSIHILVHLKETARKHNLDAVSALRRTIRQVWFPCLFTSLTTGAGFLSFYTSDIRPVAVLGLFTAISVMLAFILSIMTLPPLVSLMPQVVGRALDKIRSGRQPGRQTDGFFRVLLCLGRFATRRKWFLFFVFAGVVVLAVLGIMRLRFETNTINYLPEDNPIKKDFTVIENHFGGTIPFVIWIRSENGKNFENPQILRRMDAVQQTLVSEHAVITHGFSIVNYLKEFNQAINGNDPDEYRIPDSRLDIMDAYELVDPAVLDRTISMDHRQIAMTFLSTWKSNEEGYRLHARARSFLENKLGADVSFRITGLSSLYLSMDRNLQQGQQRSFLTAFTIIFLVMLFVCRNFWLAVFAMVPNLFPIVMTLGLMGWLGIPLDVATIMIASVTIGIAVDDSIHFITWIRRNIALQPDSETAMVQTFADVGKPIVITTLILFAGFFVMILGGILPTRMFGMLTAFAMVFAVIGDMFVLPPLILIFKPGLPPLPAHAEDEKH